MPNDTATLAAPAQAIQLRPDPQVPAAFTPRDAFELAQREAKVYASSTLVPAQYRDNVGNCLIAMNMARRIGADILMTMQNLYIVHGNPGWSGKFLIATFNQCGRFSAMRFEMKEGVKDTDPDFGCRAYATEKATGEKIVGPWVTWKMVRAEKWDDKSGSKWKTMPDLMFHYRAAAFLVRTHAPEIAMGLQTIEELHDTIDVTPQGSTQSAALDGINATISGKPAPQTIEHDPSGGVPSFMTQSPGPGSEAPTITYATVLDAINRAPSCDILDVARDMIEAITDEGQRAELDVAERKRRSELAK